MSFTIRQAWPTDLDAVAAVAEQAQTDPQRFIAYVGDDAASIAADLTEIDGVDGWTAATHVALDDARNVIGWLAGERDADIGRVWWWGPFLADEPSALHAPLADALLRAGRQSVADFTEQELAIDERSELLRDVAERHGFVAEEGSVALRTEAMTSPSAPTDGASRRLQGADHDAVATLHDALFPGTHTPGKLLVEQADNQHDRFVASIDDDIVGYVATQVDNDGSLYIDYLGVAPSHRSRGLGRSLIGTALAARPDASFAHLTVRASNTAARRLYASLGFVEERVLVPLRRGFTLR